MHEIQSNMLLFELLFILFVYAWIRGWSRVFSVTSLLPRLFDDGGPTCHPFLITFTFFWLLCNTPSPPIANDPQTLFDCCVITLN